MTEAEIKLIVRATVNELKKANLLKDTMGYICSEVSKQLYNYYKRGYNSETVEPVLDKLHEDVYFDIIPMYYREQKTIEDIADRFGADNSTISRNKKRLCMEIYNAIQE